MRMWLSNGHAGTIIGKGGTNIKGIREQSGCKCSIETMVPGSTERLLSLTGTTLAINKATELMLTVLEEQSKDLDPAVGMTHSLKLVLSNKQAGGIIGKGGAIIKEMRELSTASIKVESAAEVQTERFVTVGGSKQAVIQAISLLSVKLSTMPDDMPAQPSKHQKTNGASGGFPGMDTSFPGAPQGFPGYNPGGYPGYGSAPPGYPGYGGPPGFPPPQQGFGGIGMGGSAPGSAAIAGVSGSMEQLVDVALVGRLIGKGGSGIKELRNLSGAKIQINSECEAGTQQRKVTVSGTPDQTQIALTMIQQKLAMGP
eukprot:CAMPEP_0119346162 /NCGR_PEP_ID=MMETSP1333-20130426/107864_1 /TAXON_ID=418940 /ORGANISM="Scyphosphaera apsteinii, Strain RCC1455" /LENGTH=312 /DNA_ID=CAMNT_0007358661 /DNA_START=143 /DNA_END=1081 /DNA_ORIENTATION=+